MQAGGLTDYLTGGSSGLHSSRGTNQIQPMAPIRQQAPGTSLINKGKHQLYSRELSNVKMSMNKGATHTSHGLRNSS